MAIVTATTYLLGTPVNLKARVCYLDRKPYLKIGRRQMSNAIKRYGASSRDYLILTEVPGYGVWHGKEDGSWICYTQQS